MQDIADGSMFHGKVIGPSSLRANGKWKRIGDFLHLIECTDQAGSHDSLEHGVLQPHHLVIPLRQVQCLVVSEIEASE